MFAVFCKLLGFLLQFIKGHSFSSHFKTPLFLKLSKSPGSKFQVHFLFRMISNQEMLYRHGFLIVAVEYAISKIQGDCGTFNANGTHQILG
jgi:hypothetical protein